MMKAFLELLVKKIGSRKFLMGAAGVIVGVVIAFGGDADRIQAIAGAVVSLVSLVTYIRTEGQIDANAVKKAVDVLIGESENGNTNAPKS